MSFRLKTILGIAFIQLVLLAILVTSSLHMLRNSNEKALLDRAVTTTRFIATSVKDAVIATDLAALTNFTATAMGNPDLLYVRILDADGHVLAEDSFFETGRRPFDKDTHIGHVDDHILDLSETISEGGELFGQVQAGFATQQIDDLLHTARIEDLSIALLLLVITTQFAFFLSTSISRQLRSLAEGAQRVAEGDLGYQVAIKGNDEAAQASRSFNAMSQQLLITHNELESALEMASNNEAELARAQKVAQLGSWEFDRQHNALRCSAQVCAMLGIAAENPLTLEQVMGHVHPDDRSKLNRYLHTVTQTGQSQEMEFRVQNPDGSERFVHVYAEPQFDAGHRLIGLFGIAQDITARRHAEQEAREERLERMDAQMASQAKSQFLANMSHELRTPLNAIIGYSELIAEDLEDGYFEEASADLKKIYASGKHLLSVIDKILDLSKIEAGKMELDLEDIDLAALLEEVKTTVHPMADNNRNRLSFTLAPDLGHARTDATKLRQTLLNLLSNACKFTMDGNIHLDARREKDTTREWLVFKVSDTGIGMAQDQIEHLFKPFTQADISTTRKYGGTGLGLTISQDFCEMMGGKISIDSTPGLGSTFTVRLPADIPEPVNAAE